MSENETKHEKILKQTQILIAILAGLVTFIVGAYNVKGFVFSKKGPGAVSVLVRTENGQPASNASIEITKIQGGVVASSNTGLDGKYEQPKLEPGNYSLKITKAKFQAETFLFSIEPAHTTELDLKLKSAPNSIRSSVEEVGASWIKKFGAEAP